MRDPGLVRAGARVRGPSIQVRVKVDDRDGSIHLVQRAQDWQYDGVVASQAGKAPPSQRCEPLGRRVAHLTMRGCCLPSFAKRCVTEEEPDESLLATERARSVEYATSIWSTAKALSNGLTGTCKTKSRRQRPHCPEQMAHYTHPRSP